MLTQQKISELLKLPIPLTVYDTAKSTNDLAKALAYDRDGEFCIIAREQSAGRGRMGRSFHSPNGGLYMSLVLRPDIHATEALTVTTTAALAVCRAIDTLLGVRCGIKWVNDVYLNGKKVCGILTESAVRPDGMLDFTVLGIGVNLVEPPGGFPEDIKARAGALFKLLPKNADNILAAGIINEFMALWQSRNAAGNISEYRERSILIGREVDVMRTADGEGVPATVIGIDDEYRLVVRYRDGNVEELFSGDASIKM